MQDRDIDTAANGGVIEAACPVRMTWRELLVHGIMLLVLLVVLFPSVFFKGEMTVPGTLLFESAPWSHHQPRQFTPVRYDTSVESLSQFALWHRLVRDSLDTGEWPLWNPLEFAGIPLLANYQSAVFYPIHLLDSLLDIPWP